MIVLAQADFILDQLEDRLAHRCRGLIERPEFIHGLTGFYWWLEAVA